MIIGVKTVIIRLYPTKPANTTAYNGSSGFRLARTAVRLPSSIFLAPVMKIPLCITLATRSDLLADRTRIVSRLIACVSQIAADDLAPKGSMILAQIFLAVDFRLTYDTKRRFRRTLRTHAHALGSR